MAKSNYERVKEWRAKNRDKVAAQSKRRKDRNPNKIRALGLAAAKRHIAKDPSSYREKAAAAARQRRINNPAAQRERVRRFKQRMRAAQEIAAGRPRPEVCDVCGELHLRIVFDHCHKSGQFRGWLCDRCNRVLGLVYDKTELLIALGRYLDGHWRLPKDQFPLLRRASDLG